MVTGCEPRMCMCTESVGALRADARDAVHVHKLRKLLIVTARADGPPLPSRGLDGSPS
jgi:hypothetical protein